MTRQPTAVDQIADAYLERMVELSPGFATYVGRPGSESLLDDESPEAADQYHAERKQVLAKLAGVTAADVVAGELPTAFCAIALNV